jgi:hypothetical protein
VVKENATPSFVYRLAYIELIVGNIEENEFVSVDFFNWETRNFSPGSVGVVAVLKIFGSNNYGGQKHSSAA